MLVAGIYGKGASAGDLTDLRGCTNEEYRSHISLWSLMSAPLFITADPRKLNTAILEMLTNPEVTDVDQDAAGAFPVKTNSVASSEVWLKKMSDGSRVLALFNKGEAAQSIRLDQAAPHLPRFSRVRDLWLRRDINRSTKHLNFLIPALGVRLLRLF